MHIINMAHLVRRVWTGRLHGWPYRGRRRSMSRAQCSTETRIRAVIAVSASMVAGWPGRRRHCTSRDTRSRPCPIPWDWKRWWRLRRRHWTLGVLRCWSVRRIVRPWSKCRPNTWTPSVPAKRALIICSPLSSSIYRDDFQKWFQQPFIFIF